MITFTTNFSSLLILSLIFYQAQTGDANSNCAPSACGAIRNISSPFRLKTDPNHCGDRKFELSCEDNITFLYQNSHRYYVKDINYLIARIRLVDASIDNRTLCSFPNYTFFTDSDSPYRTVSAHSAPYGGYVAWPINFISCRNPNPSTNSSNFTEIHTQCASNSSQSTFDYIKVGRVRASEVPHMCSVDLMAFTSWEFRDLSNVSLSEIHESLLYGFELYVCSWWWCSERTTTNWEKFTNWLLGTNGLLLLIPLAILGVSLPVTIIIGLIGVLVLSLTTFPEYWPYYFTYYLFPNGVRIGSDFVIIALLVLSLVIVVWFTAAVNILVAITVGFAGALVLSFVLMENFTYSFGAGVAPKFIFTGVISSMIICAPRIIIGPFAVWFLIYKF
ncbi:uncharacterized protein LOC125213825 isoform X2 [Salvia hispanica]|uniref:uncharacterized protein LOC125213825 isoform X2 n=1 Tax=Salvia hispanica TaxID=49212 RepID=UPI0020098837|nr:uncharacterized protein LOC125213825 isoform X2 [Salvia hispanica]